MANTFSQIYLQFVFAVQNRCSLIKEEWKNELYKYIAGIVQNNHHKMIVINGVADQIHLFIGYKPQQLIPMLLQEVKGCSSKWINERKFVRGKFTWQEGYGVISYSHSQIDAVVKYILNQEQHHKQKNFQEEYRELLIKFNLSFDERYIFQEIE